MALSVMLEGFPPTLPPPSDGGKVDVVIARCPILGP